MRVSACRFRLMRRSNGPPFLVGRATAGAGYRGASCRGALRVHVQHVKDARAEILVMRQAARLLGEWNFPDRTIYSSLEPCPMCENAMLQAEVPEVLYGGAGFPIALEIRFARSNIQRMGPIMQECRVSFVDWARRVGRTDILEGEDV